MNNRQRNLKVYPKSGLEDLQYNEILSVLASYARTEYARDNILKLEPSISINYIQLKLNEVAEYRTTLEEGEEFRVSEFNNCEPYLSKLKMQGYVLDSEEIIDIFNVLKLNKNLEQKVEKYDYESRYPHLFHHCKGVFPQQELLNQISRVYDDNGEVKEDASPELKRVSMALKSANKRLEKEFNDSISEYRNAGYLTDSEQTVRNGRRVISVPAEYKRTIRGIIHDASASGKTVFVEPEAVINVNNDIFDLYNDRRKEIYRLKREISASLHEIVDDFPSFQHRLIQFDIIGAKAELAIILNASSPQLNKKSKLRIKDGMHPLLFLKNNKNYEATIPFNLELDDEKRLLLLSGPNAGGKSVLLKAVGLIQVMVQSGLQVPVDEVSDIYIVNKLVADIGDHQSVDDDLSTYSSHLETMKLALTHIDKKSMILFDEFGTGTDPRLGGAIAEGILKEIVSRKTMGVMTTHYGNLKTYAHNSPHIVNGAMLFDNKELRPTYQFLAGKPGSSFTFEIATKTGLPKKVLSYAKKNAGYDQVKIEELLNDLQTQKQEIQKERLKVLEEQKRVQNLMNTYEHLQEELDVKRKRIKMEKKERKLVDKGKFSQELDKVINELRHERNLEKAEELKKELKLKQKEEIKEIEKIQTKISERYKAKHGEIKEGDFVKLIDSDMVGNVTEIDGDRAFVMVGSLKMTVPMKKLMHAAEPIVKKSSKAKVDIKAARSSENKLDIRGLDIRESGKVIDSFLDSAILQNLNKLEIVHGKGTGALRKLVHQKLREYKGISDFYHPERNQGGEGVTLVDIY